MVWIPKQVSSASSDVATPGYVLDVGTVSDPTNPDVLNVGGASPLSIPISYGRRAIFGVVIWTGNFTVVTNSDATVSQYCDFAVAFGYPGVPADELLETKLCRLWIESSTTLGAGARLIFDRTTPGGYALSADLDMTIYTGTEDQLPDELISQVSGADFTPAFRGMIYIVFRNFNLAKYGLTAVPQLRAELADITASINYFVPFERNQNATAILTFNTNPVNGATVTIDGTIYTFTSQNADVAYKVKIGANIDATRKNLLNAINGTGTPGFDTYGVDTIAHTTVKAVLGDTINTLKVTAINAGTAGNSITVSQTIDGSWSSATLVGSQTSSDYPDRSPVTCDWQRNRAYYTVVEAGNVWLLSYDISTTSAIARLPITDENGNPMSDASLNNEYIWQVDESSGVIYTTIGGTANNTALCAINSTTGRIINRVGTISISFPKVTGIPGTISFPTRMRFAFTTLGYGEGAGTRRYAIITTLFNDLFLIGLKPNGALVGPISKTTYPGHVLGLQVQDSLYTRKNTKVIPGETFVSGGGTRDFYGNFQLHYDTYSTGAPTIVQEPSDIYGIRAYVATANVIYQTVWSTVLPNYETPKTASLAVLPDNSIVDNIVWDDVRKDLLVFYKNTVLYPSNPERLRRYSWVNNIFTLIYDVSVPNMGLSAFESGYQDSKVEIAQYGYISSMTGPGIVVDTQTGSYHVYDLTSYVEYSTDFDINENATPQPFDFVPNPGVQPFSPSGGFFVCRPTISGGAVGAGLLYVDGILNARVPLRDLLRWLCLSAGYTDDQIDISHDITDKVLGAYIDQSLDIFSLITALGIVFDFIYFESEDKIKFVRTKRGSNLTIEADLTINNIATISGNGQIQDQESFLADLAPKSATPDTMALTFIDFTNDYQPSTVTARKSHFPFEVEKNNQPASYSIPIIMLPAEAISRIYKALYFASAVRLTTQFRTGPEFLRLEPADAVSLSINEVSYTMALYELTVNADYSLTIGGETLSTEEIDIQTSADDIPVVDVPTIIGSYIGDIIIIDSSLFAPSDEPLDQTSLVNYFVAYGYSSSWSGTVYYAASGDQLQPLTQAFLPPPIIATVTSDIIDTGLEHFTDEDASIEIQLLNPRLGFPFESVTDEDLTGDSNYAVIGNSGTWEVIQFKNVTDLAGGAFLLEGIIRGLRNTEHNMGLHQSGSFFIPIFQFVPQKHIINENLIGQSVFYTVRDPHQEQILTSPVEYVVTGVSRKPWSPNDYSATFDTDHFVLAWHRRTRITSELMDGTGTVSEEYTQERYEIDIYDTRSNTVVQTIPVTGSETYNYPQADFNTDAFPHTTSDQIILNPGAELLTANWTTTSGALGTWGTGHTGSRSFSNTIAPVLAHQDIAVPVGFDTDIDAGNVKVLVSWWQDSSVAVVEGTAAIDVGFYDGSPGSLISSSVGTQVHEYTGTQTFVYHERVIVVPALTRTIRLTLNIPNSPSAFIDDIVCELWTVDDAPVSMKFAVFQIADDPLIGRGQGVPHTIDIAY